MKLVYITLYIVFSVQAGIAHESSDGIDNKFFTFTFENDIFAGARGGYVAHDILLNGNTFADSYSVPLEHFQNEMAAGALWSINRLAFVFSYLSTSSKTELSSDREEFGALSVNYRY